MHADPLFSLPSFLRLVPPSPSHRPVASWPRVSTLEILAQSGLKYAYAHHGGMEIDKAAGDLQRVPIDDNAIDLVLLSQALQHLQHPSKRSA